MQLPLAEAVGHEVVIGIDSLALICQWHRQLGTMSSLGMKSVGHEVIGIAVGDAVVIGIGSWA